jgi:hypothetical protein
MPHLSPRTLTEAEQRRLLKVRHGLHHVVKKMRVHDRDWIEIWYAVPNAKGPGEDLPGPSDVVHEPLRMAPQVGLEHPVGHADRLRQPDDPVRRRSPVQSAADEVDTR